MKKLFLFLLLAVFAVSAFAQTEASLRGSIRARNLKPVKLVLDAHSDSLALKAAMAEDETITADWTFSKAITGASDWRGSNTFTTTAIADTVVISGALATDYYIVMQTGTGSVDAQDVLMVEAKEDTLIVHRLASGASGLAYDWFRFK